MDVIEVKSGADVSNSTAALPLLPVTVIIPVRNEARNLPRCLAALRSVGEVFVVDSQSSDETCAIAESADAKVVQFHYQGGWPKKRQWAMDTLPISHDWILLLDATIQGPRKIRSMEAECLLKEAVQDIRVDICPVIPT